MVYMEKINPQSTQDFLQQIKSQKSIEIEVGGARIRLCKNVFPPKMIDSRIIQDLITPGKVKGKTVLDVGTGTGIQAILAAKHGALDVTALDISDEAIECARHNIEANGVESVVSLVKSDLFMEMKDKTFDVIIANLPFVDYPAVGVAEAALYDPGLILHKRFFSEARGHLSEGGVIIFPHANLTGEKAFAELEEMINSYKYHIDSYIDVSAYGHIWRVYTLK